MSMVGSVVSPGSPTSIYTSPPSSAPHQTMDSADFMKLLIAQLQNQDPTQPMDSSEMVQQTTELGMMQKLAQVQSDTDASLVLQMRSVAASMIGRNVDYTDSDGNAASGVATSVSFSGATPLVTVDGQDVPLSSIVGVGAPSDS